LEHGQNDVGMTPVKVKEHGHAVLIDKIISDVFPTSNCQVTSAPEMTDLITLLTFPSTSDAFTAVHSSIHDNHVALPSLPLSKVARLDADSDSGSASRSRAGVHPTSTSRPVVAGGPVRVSVSGGFRECRSTPVNHSKRLTSIYSQSNLGRNRRLKTRFFSCGVVCEIS
jgi:hypothetical protein